jgi:hypothetical protein
MTGVIGKDIGMEPDATMATLITAIAAQSGSKRRRLKRVIKEAECKAILNEAGKNTTKLMSAVIKTRSKALLPKAGINKSLPF